jgi:hypothetical protein
MRELRNCGDCGAKPGELHQPGCDMERCPHCGGQMITCPCVYVVCGLDPDRLKQDHPDIYFNGPTDKMYAKWDAEWGSKRLPWTGLYPGVLECREYGFWCYGPPWCPCGPDHPDATEDLNRLIIECRWDVEKRKWVKP